MPSFERQKNPENGFSLENNRGWLEPTSVQVNPSRSIDKKSKKSKEITNQEDILGAVSDEDILKLAQLTAILPEVNKPKIRRHRPEPFVDSIEHVEPPDTAINEIPIIGPIKSQPEPPENDKKRPSWFYKSLIKPYKKKKQDDAYSKGSDVSSLSSNHSIENHSIPVTPNTSNIKSIEDGEEQKESIEEQQTMFMFDYESLPIEVKNIIDEYEQNGTATRKKIVVKHMDEFFDEEDEDYEFVNQEDVITGYETEEINDMPREIAIVNATATDTIEFKKLIQLSDDSENGPLLDLRISMFGDEGDTHEDSIRDLLRSVDTQLGSINSFESDSLKFLKENEELMESLDLSNIIIPQSSDSHQAENIKDSFENKHEEMSAMMKIFRKEIHGLQNSLNETEGLMQNIQLEMSDTRFKMETYIKDIPESHYSAVGFFMSMHTN